MRSYSVDVDWAAVYGREWAFLGDAQPLSVMLPAGSTVSVWPKQR